MAPQIVNQKARVTARTLELGSLRVGCFDALEVEAAVRVGAIPRADIHDADFWDACARASLGRHHRGNVVKSMGKVARVRGIRGGAGTGRKQARGAVTWCRRVAATAARAGRGHKTVGARLEQVSARRCPRTPTFGSVMRRLARHVSHRVAALVVERSV
ncbi:hypothetical protein CAOG_009964 [Capsaspora owczarzaki ATCC 30864]|uniref:Uncharacterized protein n=1 Tax=Capsaspora owczarzaki (strain ATCC 30864) TaxID=595528 RepID=A0A0D2UKZ4_CAPO3|nr:hypothetical protein CAOG_009964 [Capsaspora owczarzaki ATCC 30864]